MENHEIYEIEKITKATILPRRYDKKRCIGLYLLKFYPTPGRGCGWGKARVFYTQEEAERWFKENVASMTPPEHGISPEQATRVLLDWMDGKITEAERDRKFGWTPAEGAQA